MSSLLYNQIAGLVSKDLLSHVQGVVFFLIVARGPLIYCYNSHTIINILSFTYYCYIYIHFMRFSGKPKALRPLLTHLVCAELSKFVEGIRCR